MSVEPNHLVELNNARNLPSGTVLERPTGNLGALWAAYARVLEAETVAKRQSSRKKRREEEQ